MITRLSFQKQLSFGFSAISLLSMVVCSFFSYYFVSGIVKDLTISNLSDQIRGVESAISVTTEENYERHGKMMDLWSKKIISNLEIDKAEGEERTIANQVTQAKTQAFIPAVYYSGKKITNSELVDSINAQSGNVSTIFVRFAEGFTRVSTSVFKENGERATNSFIPNDSPVVSELLKKKRYLGRALVVGKWYLTAYDPIIQNGEVVGAFFMGVPETTYNRIKNYLKAQKILKTGYFYILDSNGNMILHPTLEGKNVFEQTDLDGRHIFKEIVEKKVGHIIYRWMNAETKQVQKKLALFRYFPQLDWYVSAGLNYSEAEEDVVKLRWILFFIAIGMTAGMALATVLFGRRVATRLGLISQNLAKSSDQVGTGAKELASTSELLGAAASEQASSLQETVSAVEEIRSTVTRNLETTRLTEDLSNKMSQEASTGAQILSELTDRVNQIANVNDQVGQEMKASHAEIQKIIDVISVIEQKTQVINEIVFQTKLLSFNASVEAARAGEHGKGFSVVAEEVGRLAQLSGNAAEEIRSSLEKSRSEVKSIIDQAQTKMEKLIAEAAGQTTQGVQVATKCQSTFDGILSQISQAHQGIGEIATASKEQAQGIEEINKAMIQMDQVTHHNAESAHKTEKLSAQLRTNAIEMEEAVKTLKIFLQGS